MAQEHLDTAQLLAIHKEGDSRDRAALEHLASCADAGEDTNGNGRLDADWNLTATSVTFNRRRPDLSYSLPITFRLTDDKIEHVVQTDPGGASITTAIARRVTEFDISEGTSMVTITLGITIPVSAEDNISRSQSINVTPRN